MDQIEFEMAKLTIKHKKQLDIQIVTDSMYPLINKEEHLIVIPIKDNNLKRFQLIVF